MYYGDAHLHQGYGGRPTAEVGGMAEWLKAHDSKSCRPPKGLEGSNPSPSANSCIRADYERAARDGGGRRSCVLSERSESKGMIFWVS